MKLQLALMNPAHIIREKTLWCP